MNEPVVQMDPGYNELTDLVGQSLQAWSTVETRLGIMFHIVTDVPSDMAHAIMATIVSFKARIQVCNAAFRFVDMSDIHRAFWNSLYNRLSKQYDRRNELAHFSIIQDGQKNGRLLWWVVPYFSIGSLPDCMDKRLSAADIRLRIALFNKLANEIMWLDYEMIVRRGRLAANPLPIPDRVQELSAQAAQTPKGTQPPLQS